MADMTVELIEGSSSALAQKILSHAAFGVSGKGSMLMFSGGIGHNYYNPIPINRSAMSPGMMMWVRYWLNRCASMLC